VTEAGRSLLVSTIAGEGETPLRMGSASYSYSYVDRAFAPLLQRWGRVVESVRPADRIDEIARREKPLIHVGFLPLDMYHRTTHAPNVGFPFWDFPDVPAVDLGGDRRNNWVATANDLDLLLTGSEFTRDAFTRSGVRTPVSVVPVPVRPAYFEVQRFETNQRVVVDCRFHEVTPAPSRVPERSRTKEAYRRYVAPRLSRRSAGALSTAASAFAKIRGEWRENAPASSESLELNGIVYTTVVNPFDQRKNWPDLLTAYLLALAGCDDATLVMKLAVPPDRAASGVNAIVSFYRRLDLAHRCRLVLVSDYLSYANMAELTRGTTYYLNSSRAEGACLPLQNFLAAGRPAIAPRHTAIGDYFSADAGFVVDSHPEPASWPQDPEGRCTTTWHRLVWQSLHDAIRESYSVAKSQRARYEELARNARASMTARADAEAVWPRLKAALDSVVDAL
jgi:glycosyltransferase involved in cell wall biosynthesis